jgi:hypothetical protein
MTGASFLELANKQLKELENTQLLLSVEKILNETRKKRFEFLIATTVGEVKLPKSVTSHINGIASGNMEIKILESEFAKRSGEFANSPSSKEIISVYRENSQHVSSFSTALAKRQIQLRLTGQKQISQEAISTFVHLLDDSAITTGTKWYLQWHNDNVEFQYAPVLSLVV